MTPRGHYCPSSHCHSPDRGPTLVARVVGTTESIQIPPQEGRAVKAPKGASIRIIDVEGHQVADVFAFNADDVSEYHSPVHTRAALSHLFPREGQAFVSNRRRPMLVLERDDSPAVHDMLIAACDPQRYEGLGVEGHHASCRENVGLAMKELGHTEIPEPDSINV